VTRFRRELPAEITGTTSDLVGPIAAPAAPLEGTPPLDGPLPQPGFALYRVVRRQEARFDGETAAAVEGILVERWVDELRATVPVEWNWGPASSPSMEPPG
jgi:hypothetical protein